MHERQHKASVAALGEFRVSCDVVKDADFGYTARVKRCEFPNFVSGSQVFENVRQRADELRTIKVVYNCVKIIK